MTITQRQSRRRWMIPAVGLATILVLAGGGTGWYLSSRAPGVTDACPMSSSDLSEILGEDWSDPEVFVDEELGYEVYRCHFYRTSNLQRFYPLTVDFETVDSGQNRGRGPFIAEHEDVAVFTPDERAARWSLPEINEFSHNDRVQLVRAAERGWRPWAVTLSFFGSARDDMVEAREADAAAYESDLDEIELALDRLSDALEKKGECWGMPDCAPH